MYSKKVERVYKKVGTSYVTITNIKFVRYSNI